MLDEQTKKALVDHALSDSFTEQTEQTEQPAIYLTTPKRRTGPIEHLCRLRLGGCPHQHAPTASCPATTCSKKGWVGKPWFDTQAKRWEGSACLFYGVDV